MDTILIGAGGHGKVVLDILRAQATHRPVGFIDADPALTGTTVAGLPVLGQINFLPKLKAQKIKAAIVSIGDNRIRQTYAKLCEDNGLQLINAVHPAASVSPTATLGKNVVVAAGAILCAEVTLADSVIVNTSAVVDHECQIGPGVHLCPGSLLAGRVRVDASAFIGMGAKILPCLSIGAEATIGAGAVVLKDVPPRATAVGVPAKIIKISD